MIMEKKKVGITGQAGFIGSHLANFLMLHPDFIDIIPFQRDYFAKSELLDDFVSKCDVVIHTAGVNRGPPDDVHKGNIRLATILKEALERVRNKPHLIFLSSTQEEQDNPYGASKKKAREILAHWAVQNNAHFAGLIVPNVFGPFCRPFYNSVIATFCYQVTHKENPKIIEDNKLSLIYVNELVEIIGDIIKNSVNNNHFLVEPNAEVKVSKILRILNNYSQVYFKKYQIPNLKDGFEISLFNTFRSYLDYNFFPVLLAKHTDVRGYLCEIIKSDVSGQVFYSHTKPGITRGNHFHRRKIERFCVIEGEGVIRLRRKGTTKIHEYKINGHTPSVIDIPIWHVHNITNIGKNDLCTLFWSNEIFDYNNSDTYFEEV